MKYCSDEEIRLRNECRKVLPPFSPHIVRRFTACIYGKISTPDNIKTSELLNYATTLARELKTELCVRMDYDLCYWVGIDGKCKKDHFPAQTPKSAIVFAGEPK